MAPHTFGTTTATSARAGIHIVKLEIAIVFNFHTERYKNSDFVKHCSYARSAIRQ